MFRWVWTAVRPVGAVQWFLWWCGALLLGSAMVHGVVFLVDGSSWLGSVSWRKPVVFGVSFGTLMWSAVWILRNLPRRWWGSVLAVLLGVSSVVEVTVITLQRWRGVPSHFNESTEFDAGIFSIMGMSVMVVALAITGFLIWSLCEFRGSPVTRVATITGLLGLAGAGYLGRDLIAAGDAVVAATGHVPEDLVFGAAGSAKLAHAIGIHGIQVLAACAILLDHGTLPVRTRLTTMLTAATGYAATFTAITATAYAGRPWTDPPLPWAALGILGVLLIAACLLRALPRRSPTPIPA
ncbi:hypothetical protein [Actinokineospora enzanensis]|uniref:hypothetical protein n=1 Tax=Actinokineospora enzanensis TaxID=155975 RepID=UPI0012EB826C|nr:hypothetical protein [Actinokineospora enzanensis]